MNSIKIDTTQWATTLGRNPRPSDQGLWVFIAQGGLSNYKLASYQGSWKEAVRYVKRIAAQDGVSIVRLAP